MRHRELPANYRVESLGCDYARKGASTQKRKEKVTRPVRASPISPFCSLAREYYMIADADTQIGNGRDKYLYGRYKIEAIRGVWERIGAVDVPVTRRNQSALSYVNSLLQINDALTRSSLGMIPSRSPTRKCGRMNHSVPSTCESRRHEYHVGTLKREWLFKMRLWSFVIVDTIVILL